MIERVLGSREKDRECCRVRRSRVIKHNSKMATPSSMGILDESMQIYPALILHLWVTCAELLDGKCIPGIRRRLAGLGGHIREQELRRRPLNHPNQH